MKGNPTLQSSYLNGSAYPYVALGSQQTFGAKVGDYVAATNNANGAYVVGVYGDYRGSNNVGIEMSPAMLSMLGIPFQNNLVTPTSVTITVFPGLHSVFPGY